MAAAFTFDPCETTVKIAAIQVAEVVEHFLPLFVGTYSAAPYRIDFMEFHPERVCRVSYPASWISLICACYGGAGRKRPASRF